MIRMHNSTHMFRCITGSAAVYLADLIYSLSLIELDDFNLFWRSDSQNTTVRIKGLD